MEASLRFNPPACYEVMVERKTLPFSRKKPPSEPEAGTVAICLNERGVEGTGKRGRQAP